jgi:hypothetical protein
VDVVYYVGGPDTDDRAELRHSLRSLDANYRGPLGDVWVVGDVPDWFTGATMPLRPKPEKFTNARQSITAYVSHSTAPTFLLMMDDIYFTEAVEQLPICHLGPVKNYSSYKAGNGTYAKAVRQTANWLMAHGHPEPLAYLGHTPVPLDTAKVRAFIDDYPVDQLLEPFLLYCVAGTDGPGTRQGNAKTAKGDTFEHKRDLPIPYLSSNPDTWPGACGDYVRGMFSEPSRWES